jgi:hypothetical protein
MQFLFTDMQQDEIILVLLDLKIRWTFIDMTQ